MADKIDIPIDVVKEMSKLSGETVSHFEAIAEKMKSIVDLAKKGNEEAKKQSDGSSKVLGSLSKMFGKHEDISRSIGKTKNLIDGMAKGGLTAWLAVIEAAVDRWQELDAAAGLFRTTTKLLSSQMGDIRKSVERINVNFAYMGVTLEKSYKSAADLYKEMQSTSLVSSDMIEATTLFETNLGIASSHVARLHSLFGAMKSDSTTMSVKLTAVAARLSEMAGIAPNEVLEDMANASSTALSFLAKNPIQLMRATVEARRLGTSIKSISESARGMLNFQDSITSEMEASALIGRNVNFQLARQLAFEGKIVESRKAALQQIEAIGDFSKLNVYQQEALAKASGMQVDEIIKQQNQQKMLNALRLKDKKSYDEYMKMVKDVENEKKGSIDQLAKEGLQMKNQMKMQTEMNKLANSFNQIWTDIASALLPIANAIMPIVVWLVKGVSFLVKSATMVGPVLLSIYGIIQLFPKILISCAEHTDRFRRVFVSMARPVANFAKSLSDIPTKIGKIFSSLGKLSWISKIVKPIIGIFSKISSFLGIAGKVSAFLGPFLKFVPILGWIITAVQFIFNLIKRWKEAPDGFLGGLKAVGLALYDTLLKPFVDLWDWLKSHILGNSPSQLGLGIVKGIKSVGNMLFEVLMWPFNKLMSALSKLPIIGKLFGGAKDFANSLNPFSDGKIEMSDSTTKIEGISELVDSIKKLTDVISSASKISVVDSSTSKTNATDTTISGKLDELIDLMKSGGIAVNIDGRLVSSRLAAH